MVEKVNGDNVMQEHSFEWELRNLLYAFGYSPVPNDGSYFIFPGSEGEDIGKLFEAISDALERGL